MSDYNLNNEFNKALLLEKENKTQDALALYANIAKSNPTFRPAFFNLASLYNKLNKLEDSINFFSKANSISEDYITWFNIGSLNYKLKNYKKAIISFEKSKILNPKFTTGLLASGIAYSRLNNFKAAESSFNSVLKLDTKNETALNALSLLYYEKKYYKKSIETCNKLISFSLANKNITRLMSKLFYEIGEFEKAADILKQNKEKDNKLINYDNFIKKLPIETYSDRYGTIENKIQRLESLCGKDQTPENLISLSLCHLLKGDTDKAIDVLFLSRKNTN